MNNAGTVNIKINDIEYVVPADISILQAAKSVGINIPTLCFLENYPPHTSCYLCLVKIAGMSHYMPACATKVVNMGNYTTLDDEIAGARRDALELLLSEHRGDCIAPCRIACPAHMNIPEMMSLINAGKWDEAIAVVKKDIAMPAIFGRICPAYCEKACKRKQFDESLSICTLKKITAYTKFTSKIIEKNKSIAIIGAGVSGLSAAYHLRSAGYKIDIYEKENLLLSKLRQKYSQDVLPNDIIEREIAEILDTGIKVIHNKVIIDDSFCHQYDTVLAAAGIENDLTLEKDDKGHIKVKHYATSRDGVFACGSAVIGSHDPVRSMASGRFAASIIDKYLGGSNIINESLFSTRLGQLSEVEKEHFLSLWRDITGEFSVTRKESINTNSEAVLEAGRCLRCSCLKSDECKLRNISIACEANTHKYEHDHKKPYRIDFSHSSVIFEASKCIKCGICISISKEDSGAGISFINRGYVVELAVPFDDDISIALVETALKCADNCPTGAISRRKNVIEG
ncbi:MAG: FAD-dependent oxidoreductase [bacterium]